MGPTVSLRIAYSRLWMVLPLRGQSRQMRKLFLIWSIPLVSALALALFWTAIFPGGSTATRLVAAHTAGDFRTAQAGWPGLLPCRLSQGRR